MNLRELEESIGELTRTRDAMSDVAVMLKQVAAELRKSAPNATVEVDRAWNALAVAIGQVQVQLTANEKQVRAGRGR